MKVPGYALGLKLLITGTLISIFIMTFTGHPLKKSSSDYKSILYHELANTSSKVEPFKAINQSVFMGKLSSPFDDEYL